MFSFVRDLHLRIVKRHRQIKERNLQKEKAQLLLQGYLLRIRLRRYGGSLDLDLIRLRRFNSVDCPLFLHRRDHRQVRILPHLNLPFRVVERQSLKVHDFRREEQFLDPPPSSRQECPLQYLLIQGFPTLHGLQYQENARLPLLQVPIVLRPI